MFGRTKIAAGSVARVSAGLLTALLFTGFAAGCLLTDPLGIPPAGSRSGAEIKAEIFDATVVAFAQGVAIFGSVAGIEDDLTTAALTAGLLGEELIGLEDDLFYERGAARGCVDAITGAVPFMVPAFLAERQECPDAPAECAVDQRFLGSVARQTAAWLPLIGCGDIQRTKRLIHFFEIQL